MVLVNLEAEVKQTNFGCDLTESMLFGVIARLRKTDNILLITNMANYPAAKEIIAKHPEMRIRIAGLPGNLPGNDSYAWVVIDLNDLQAIYSPGA